MRVPVNDSLLLVSGKRTKLPLFAEFISRQATLG